MVRVGVRISGIARAEATSARKVTEFQRRHENLIVVVRLGQGQPGSVLESVSVSL